MRNPAHIRCDTIRSWLGTKATPSSLLPEVSADDRSHLPGLGGSARGRSAYSERSFAFSCNPCVGVYTHRMTTPARRRNVGVATIERERPEARSPRVALSGQCCSPLRIA